MDTYVILSKLSVDAFHDPTEIPRLAEDVTRKIKEQCPNIHWKDSYVTMGQFDVMDIVQMIEIQ